MQIVAALMAALLAMLASPAAQQSVRAPALESVPFAPRRTICYRAPAKPRIDGRLDEEAWSRAPWSEPFVDIEGDRRPRPVFRTRMKMLWDADYLYVAADMEEPDVWGTLAERDSVIFRDNDFEVFIDPDGDTHEYYELEVNALGTAWDLMLVRPYRDGGPALNAWHLAGLELGVDVRGTVNRPGDRDDGWTVEIAMPWKILREAAPGQKAPAPGDQWRINFSRVEWQVDVRDGRYVKRVVPSTGAALPESNWVWSPQGAVDMHMPERWGFVQFSGEPTGAATPFVEDANDRVKWALRRLYYRQRDLREATGRYAAGLDALNAKDIEIDGLEFAPSISATASMYEIVAPGVAGALVHIRQDGRVWITRRARPLPERPASAGTNAPRRSVRRPATS